MKLFIPYLILMIFLISGCSVEPQPINYGADQCAFCKMTVVDKAHSAQVVTSKGRVFNFDAIECMADYVNGNNGQEYAHMMIADFSNPGNMISAESSSYLISEQIPSPMGANLSGFQSQESIDSLPEEVKGEIKTWQQIRDAR